MKAGLTAAQRTLLDFIGQHVAETGNSPSFDEMLVATGYASKSSIHRVLCDLEERGHVRRLYNRARSIVLVDQSDLPPELEAWASAYCRRHGISRSALNERAITSYRRTAA